MNEKIKSFFIGIGTGLLGVLTFLLGWVLHNRGTDDTVGTGLSRAERTCEEARRTTSEAERTNGELAGTVKRGQSILQEIRKQKAD